MLKMNNRSIKNSYNFTNLMITACYVFEESDSYSNDGHT